MAYNWTINRRFWKWVDKTAPNGCWLWTRGTTAAGYGVLTINYKITYAHRLSWEIANGPIPDKAHILHHCDIPNCVNPTHLFLGDQAANVGDATTKGRMSKGENHHAAKLDNEKVHQVRKLLRLGVPATKVAKRFCVSRGAIMDIKHNRTWKHIK